jgi:hypothetical protein
MKDEHEQSIPSRGSTLVDFAGTLKPSAVVWVDCTPFVVDSGEGIAPSSKITFRFRQFRGDRFKGVADGYGSPQRYGGGAVFANREDIYGVPFIEYGDGI